MEGSIDPENLLKGYQWPASRITKADMIRLTDLKERLGKPITEILHDAVKAYYLVLVEHSDIRPVSDLVRESQEAFHRDLPALLRDFPERWVAYAGSSQIAIADSEFQLMRECVARGFGEGVFLTFSIEPEFPIIVELLPGR